MATKWGIVSGGKISHDFTVCLRSLPADEHQVVAVATRSLESATKFASLHKIGKAYGSYEELAKDAEVEVVYIGSINTEHLKLGKMMLKHGKHLLVEKPMTMNRKDTCELVKLAQEKNLFLMEAIWSRFLPSYKFVAKQLEDNVIGDVRFASAEFGVKIDNVDRVTKKELGGSALLDVGVYAIHAVLMAFKDEKPERIKAVGHLNADGVDTCVTASLRFPNNGVANITARTEVQLTNEAKIVGTKGTITILSPMWCADKVMVNDKLHEFPFPSTVMECNFTNSSGLRYEAMEVRRCIQSGLKESPFLTLKHSELIAEIEDKIREEINR